MTTIDPIDRLETMLHERLGPDRCLRPADDGYRDTTALWNAAVGTRPALVVRPRDTAQTASAVRAAAECGVGLAVRGGGHDWAGRALCDGLVIDLAELRDVRVEDDERGGSVAEAGGGARTRDVVAAASARGLNVATGTAGVVGMAGLTLGGGYGPLLGTAGLAADNLLGAEVVLADGRVVDTADEPDLLWALRGGGGNFGVVTRMRIRLHPDRGLVGGIAIFGWHEAREVLARYDALLGRAPDELTLLMELTVAPEIGPCLLTVPVWSGDPAQASAAMEEVRALGSPLSFDVGPASQRDLLEQFDQQVPAGMHWSLRTRSVARLTPAVVDVLLDAAASRPGPGAGLGLRHFHGAAARVDADATAFGMRSDHVVVEISGGRTAEEDPPPYREWADGVRAALEPHALPGGYPNFLKAEHDEQVADAYGSHAQRLRDLKATYDPAGVFTATPLP